MIYLDLTIVFSALSAYLLFMMVHIVIFRFINQHRVIRWLVMSYTVGGLICLSISFVTIQITNPQSVNLSPTTVLFIASVAFILYSVITTGYILVLFGVIESSVRLRLLELIALAGENGIKHSEILYNYNGHTIIKKRLLRMISSGEIIQDNEYYSIGKRFSLFFLPAILAKIMIRLYTQKNSRLRELI